MFKLSRHFYATQILTKTAGKIWKQILGMIFLLGFVVIVLSIILFEVESGHACYVGDSNCHPPPASLPFLHVGDRILINKKGQISRFENVFYGIWFSFVTLTTTGYGDIVPVTNSGQVMSILLMILGTFYMAMPLTVAASTFYQVHEQFMEIYSTKNESVSSKNRLSSSSMNNKNVNPQDDSAKASNHPEPMNEKQARFQVAKLNNLCDDIQSIHKDINSFVFKLNQPSESMLIQELKIPAKIVKKLTTKLTISDSSHEDTSHDPSRATSHASQPMMSQSSSHSATYKTPSQLIGQVADILSNLQETLEAYENDVTRSIEFLHQKPVLKKNRR